MLKLFSLLNLISFHNIKGDTLLFTNITNHFLIINKLFKPPLIVSPSTADYYEAINFFNGKISAIPMPTHLLYNNNLTPPSTF